MVEASKNTPIYLQVLFAVLMGLRKQEINGLKYEELDDYIKKVVHIDVPFNDLTGDELDMNLIAKKYTKIA